MQPAYFDELLDRHPDVQSDWPDQSFTQHAASATAAEALSRRGVIMLRSALLAAILPRCRASFDQFTQALDREPDASSWHRPWHVQDGRHLPAATILSE